ncbi:MAG: pilus assembly protein TadG-related protein [Candidatus Tyrphobacter sp.]
MNGQRGQTFPIWSFGTLTVLTMLALSLSYGQMIRWQMRATNAADAAARGMLSIQTTQWNETEAALQASAVEEYRLRLTMNDLLEVIRGNGGCNDNGASNLSGGSQQQYDDPSRNPEPFWHGGGNPTPSPSPAPSASPTAGPTPNAQSCVTIYQTLRQNYLDSLTRYTNDVAVLGRLSTPTWATQVAQIKAALTQYQANCGTPSGGDCAFDYTLVEVTPRPTTYLEDVYADCCSFVVGGGTSGDPKLDLTPAEVEVVACAKTTPWVPSFWHWSGGPVDVVGRAAATSIMASQEFMYVGSLVNPASATGAVFQPSEYPDSATGSALGFSSGDEYYRIDYGGNPNDAYNSGNPAVSNGQSGFMYQATNPGLEVADGFWSTMAIKPFAGVLTPGASFACK